MKNRRYIDRNSHRSNPGHNNTDFSRCFRLYRAKIKQLYRGLVYQSFKQLQILSNVLHTPIQVLLTKHPNDIDVGYEAILDVIECYVDIYNSVHKEIDQIKS